MNQTYIFKNEQNCGPFNDDTIQEMIDCKELAGEDFCWREGWPDWLTISSVYFGENAEVQRIIAQLESVHVLPTNGQLFRRYLARFMDYRLGGMVLGAIIATTGWQSEFLKKPYIAGLLGIFIWSLIEPIFLCTFGYTPFKALLGIKVRGLDGKTLKFAPASKRTFRVWLAGVALGIPLVSTIFAILAYRKAKDTGISSWDLYAKSQVEYQKIGWAKIILLIVAIFLYLLFIAYANSLKNT